MLCEGIGDTIRFSLTADPVEEARAGRKLLEALGLRERKGLDLIACPSCGRTEIDVIDVARRAQEALEARKIPLQVAVMGCVVNGPGEARGADIGIAAGRHKGHLFIKGKIVRVVPESEMVEALVTEAERIVAEGIEAGLGPPTQAPRPRRRPTGRCSLARRAPTPTAPTKSSPRSARRSAVWHRTAARTRATPEPSAPSSEPRPGSQQVVPSFGQ